MSKKEEVRIRARNKELIIPAVVLGMFLILAFWVGFFAGEIAVLGALAVLAALSLMVQFALISRFRHEANQREHVYRQIEALLAVYASLPIASPLPSMRGWAVSPDVARLIISLIFERKPRLILDVGSGVSTLVSGYSLKKVGAGQVMALDHNGNFADRCRQEIINHGLEGFAAVLFAPLKDVALGRERYIWYDTVFLEELPSAIDVVIIDGPPERTHSLARYPALPLIWAKLAKDAVIVVDDASTPATKKTLDLWLARLPGLTCSIVETEKGTAILRKITG